MSIWNHSDASDAPSLALVLSALKRCVYCNGEMESHDPGWEPARWQGKDLWCMDTVNVCPVCGWWIAERQAEGDVLRSDQCGPNGEGGTYGALLLASVGALKNLDVTDHSTPVEEVRTFLAARYESRFDVHPRLMEETVGSVFSSLGYSAVVTGYSGDDGIDVILSDSASNLVGVQVKRYKNRITVEQLRSLAGALVLGNYTRGIFITTSTFSSGAGRTARRFEQRGVPVDLVDAEKFLATLKLAQITSYRERPKEQLPFNGPPMTCIARSYYSCSASTQTYPFTEPQSPPWASEASSIVAAVQRGP